MSFVRVFVASRVALLAASVVFLIADNALAVGINDYQQVRSFSLPAPNIAFSQVLFDPLPNGRLMLLNGSSVSVETAPKSGAFTVLGNVAGFAPSFGPSFLAISPDGTHAAAGSNGGGFVTVFDTSNPSLATNYPMSDFSGEWIDNRYLAVANSAAGSTVQVLDTNTSSVTTVINNIGGASAGVAFDAAGNMYTGNAFDFAAGGSDVGWTKAFSSTAWHNALNTNTPLDFETTGTPVADLLTAFPIGFDNSGNMYVGGGDLFGTSLDYGYAALVDASAVAAALVSPQSTPPISPASSASILRKIGNPPDDLFEATYLNFNGATGELYLTFAFGNGNVRVLAPVPEPASGCLLLVGAVLFTAIRTRRQK